MTSPLPPSYEATEIRKASIEDLNSEPNTNRVPNIALLALACLTKYFCPCFRRPQPSIHPYTSLTNTRRKQNPGSQETSKDSLNSRTPTPASDPTIDPEIRPPSQNRNSPFESLSSRISSHSLPESSNKLLEVIQENDYELDQRPITPIKAKKPPEALAFIRANTPPPLTARPGTPHPNEELSQRYSSPVNLKPSSSPILGATASKETLSNQNSQGSFQPLVENLLPNINEEPRDEKIKELKKKFLFLPRKENALRKELPLNQTALDSLKEKLNSIESEVDLITAQETSAKETLDALIEIKENIEGQEETLKSLKNKSFPSKKNTSISAEINDYKRKKALYQKNLAIRDLSRYQKTLQPLMEIEKEKKRSQSQTSLCEQSLLKLLQKEHSFLGTEKEISDLTNEVENLYTKYNKSLVDSKPLQKKTEEQQRNLLEKLKGLDSSIKNQILDKYPFNKVLLIELLEGRVAEESFLDNFSLDLISDIWEENT